MVLVNILKKMKTLFRMRLKIGSKKFYFDAQKQRPILNRLFIWYKKA